MEWHEIVPQLLDKNTMFPILFGVGVVLIVAMKTVAGLIASSARERTRREIAAYIAEGSMTPEQGERLMKAGSDRTCG